MILYYPVIIGRGVLLRVAVAIIGHLLHLRQTTIYLELGISAFGRRELHLLAMAVIIVHMAFLFVASPTINNLKFFC